MTVFKFFVFFSAFFIIKTVSGQDFEVSPVIIHSGIEPGESETKTIHITNHSNVKGTFMMTVGDFYKDNKGNKQFLPPNSIKLSAADRIDVSPGMLDINPGEAKEATITITVPPGDYSSRWAAVFVQSVKEQTAFNADKNLATAINVSGRIVIEIYQSPKSNTNNKARLTDLKEITSEYESMRKFSVNVDNTGEKLIKGKIYLVASNIETGKETKFNYSKFDLLPQSSRTMELYMQQDSLSHGTYSLAALLDYGNAQNLEGMQIVIKVPKE